MAVRVFRSSHTQSTQHILPFYALDVDDDATDDDFVDDGQDDGGNADDGGDFDDDAVDDDGVEDEEDFQEISGVVKEGDEQDVDESWVDQMGEDGNNEQTDVGDENKTMEIIDIGPTGDDEDEDVDEVGDGDEDVDESWVDELDDVDQGGDGDELDDGENPADAEIVEITDVDGKIVGEDALHTACTTGSVKCETLCKQGSCCFEGGCSVADPERFCLAFGVCEKYYQGE